MLRSIVDDIVRKRLWPIPVLALLVAVAAPLFFMRSADESAPVAPAVPGAVASAAQAKALPAKAESLLATAEARRGRVSGAAHDPFEPPASHKPSDPDAEAAASEKAAPVAAAAPAAPGTPSPTEPVPVIVQNGGSTSPSPTPAAPKAPSRTTPVRARPKPAPIGRIAEVDVRFGKRGEAKLHRAIPRLRSFLVRGNVVAVFAKYSPNRAKAVFAVAPGVMVTGPVRCRRKAGVCRYLDIPAGSYSRLTVRNGDGTLSRRRLDVVRIQRPGSTGRAAARRASRNAAHGRCLLRRLLRMDVGDTPVRHNACD